MKHERNELLQVPGNGKLQKFWHTFFREQEGSIAVVVAVAMAALLGFSALVMDLGTAYNEAAKLQNAMDSAALAGARELPAANLSSSEWAAAKNVALSYAAENQFDLTSDDLTPVYKDDNPDKQIIGIQATRSAVVDYQFIKVLGIQSGTLTRSATAAMQPAGAVTGAVPLSITDTALAQAINDGKTDSMLIKISSSSYNEEDGWFGALLFPGTNPADYTDLLAYGYDGEIYEGQILDMNLGNMSGPTLIGFTTRYNSCTDGCTATNYEPNCPRLVIIPVVTIGEKKTVEVQSFAAFFLNSCTGEGTNSLIYATYIGKYVVPNSGHGTSSEDFGVYTIKLTH